MRLVEVAALAASAALCVAAPMAFAHSGGGGGGGGGHSGGSRSTVIVTYGVGGYAYAPPFRGQEAAMALEIADAAPASAEGDMKLGDVIAVHHLRSADAVVPLDGIKGRRREIPAGLALARVTFAAPSQHAVVWCDVRPTGRMFWPQEHDCFEDSAHSGRLDKIWEADTQNHFLGFSLSGVDAYADPPPTPTAYRPARPEERPTASMGFKYCDGDGVTSPPRFAMVVATDEEPELKPLIGACRFGVWPNLADKSKVDVAGMILQVTPSAPGVLHYRVVSKLPVEVLGPLEPDGPILSQADTPSLAAAAQARMLAMRRPYLLPVAGTTKVSWGYVEIGQVFATIGARHAITGTLGNRIKPTGALFGPNGVTMDVGQPVFGIPVPLGEGMAWCAPQAGAAGYETACLMPNGAGYTWESKRSPAMAPNMASLNFFSGVAAASSDPIVVPGPVVFPAMQLSVKLESVTMDNAGVPAPVYHIEFDLDWGDGPQAVERDAYELTPKGRLITPLGVPILLKPAGATRMTVEAPTPAPLTPAPPIAVPPPVPAPAPVR